MDCLGVLSQTAQQTPGNAPPHPAFLGRLDSPCRKAEGPVNLAKDLGESWPWPQQHRSLLILTVPLCTFEKLPFLRLKRKIKMNK